jgi:hypothetical protein
MMSFERVSRFIHRHAEPVAVYKHNSKFIVRPARYRDIPEVPRELMSQKLVGVYNATKPEYNDNQLESDMMWAEKNLK